MEGRWRGGGGDEEAVGEGEGGECAAEGGGLDDKAQAWGRGAQPKFNIINWQSNILILVMTLFIYF